VHQNAADLPDIVVDAPDAAPTPLQLGFVFEWRRGGRREHLDRLGVNQWGLQSFSIAPYTAILCGEMRRKLAPAGSYRKPSLLRHRILGAEWSGGEVLAGDPRRLRYL
jgi:hypothetical protein